MILRNEGIVKSYLEDLENISKETNLEHLLEIDNRFDIVKKVFMKFKRWFKLEEDFIKGLEYSENEIYIFTIMWVKKIISVVLDDAIVKVLDKKHLEVIVIFATLITVKFNSRIEVYTDNLEIYNIWGINVQHDIYWMLIQFHYGKFNCFNK